MKVTQLCPTLWDPMPKNIGMGSLSLLQQIFLTQESNRGLLHFRQILKSTNTNNVLLCWFILQQFLLGKCSEVFIMFLLLWSAHLHVLWWPIWATLLTLSLPAPTTLPLMYSCSWIAIMILLLAKILAFSAHQSWMKNIEMEFRENRKVNLILSLRRGEHCRHMPQELCPAPFHGIFQARVLEWVAMSFSRGSSWPRDRTWVFSIVGRHFTIWATKTPHGSLIQLSSGAQSCPTLCDPENCSTPGLPVQHQLLESTQTHIH